MNAIVEQAVSSRVVTLTNGEKANFGARNNLLSGFDTESGVVTFKVFTGEVLEFDISKIETLGYEGFTELAKTVVGYSYLNKIKNNLAPVKLQEEVETKDAEGNVTGTTTVNSLAVAVQKEIDKLAKGDFPIRSVGGDEGVELTEDQKIFAIAAFKHGLFRKAVSLTDKQVVGWDDLEAETTINAVTSLWDTYKVTSKNAIRKNAYFSLEKGILNMPEDEDAEVEVLV